MARPESPCDDERHSSTYAALIALVRLLARQAAAEVVRDTADEEAKSVSPPQAETRK
jgi:hypothetical protein